MYWSRFHSTSFQGPVPTVAVLPNASSPTFSMCFFGTMGKNTTRSSRSGNGLSVIRWIVSALTILTSLIARTLPYCGDFFCSLPDSSTRSNENFPSSAVRIEPSWNLTPLRSLNSQVVSLSAFHERASEGSNSSFALRCRSESNMLMLTRMPTRSKCMWGSRVGACDGKATVSVSLPCAAAPLGRATSAATVRTSRPGSQRLMVFSLGVAAEQHRSARGLVTIHHAGGERKRLDARIRPEEPMNIRPNRLKEKLAAGQVATIVAGTNEPDLIDQLGTL